MVDVQVDMAEYMVDEASGSLSVCLRISGAILARPVSVTVMTVDGDAIGK